MSYYEYHLILLLHEMIWLLLLVIVTGIENAWNEFGVHGIDVCVAGETLDGFLVSKRLKQ
jgi:hypothetical protein